MTKIYGASDDLLEFEGDIYGEVGYYGSSLEDPIKVSISDGTELNMYYDDSGLWKIKVLNQGSHFESLVEATDPDSDQYSDLLTLKSGLLTARYKVGSERWKSVK
jgi:hypothetical protein